MKPIVLLLKGVLFWVTALSILFFIIGGAESLVNNNKFYLAFLWLAIDVILFFISKAFISYEDAVKVSCAEWINNLVNKYVE